jgi:DnaJ family protein C protein 28
MSDWQSAIDKMLRDAQQSSEWQNLPGEGRPLNLDDNPYAPADQKLAYKILKDNDMSPAWIMDGKELEATREKIMKRIGRAKAAGITSSSYVSDSLRDAVKDFNTKVMNYNLKVPPGIPQKRFVDIDKVLNA